MITKRCHTCGSTIRNASMDDSCESCHELRGMFDPQVGDGTYRTVKPVQSSIVKQLIETHSPVNVFHENPKFASAKKQFDDTGYEDEFAYFGTKFASIESGNIGTVLEDIHIDVIRNKKTKAAGTTLSQITARVRSLAKYLRENKIPFALLPATEEDVATVLAERGVYL